jgi:tetrahydromethanopterin S-methyltransferase subunit F
MVEELTKLLNTLKMIEVKGDNAEILVDSIRYVRGLISREQAKQSSCEQTE